MSPMDWHAQAATVLAVSEAMLHHAEAQDWPALASTEAERGPLLAALLPAPSGVDPAAVLGFIEAVITSDRQTTSIVGEAHEASARALRSLMAGDRARRAYGAG